LSYQLSWKEFYNIVISIARLPVKPDFVSANERREINIVYDLSGTESQGFRKLREALATILRETLDCEGATVHEHDGCIIVTIRTI